MRARLAAGFPQVASSSWQLVGVPLPIFPIAALGADLAAIYVPCARATGQVKQLELELIQPHMAQKPVLWGEVGYACVARKVSVERGGMGERGCAVKQVKQAPGYYIKQPPTTKRQAGVSLNGATIPELPKA